MTRVPFPPRVPRFDVVIFRDGEFSGFLDECVREHQAREGVEFFNGLNVPGLVARSFPYPASEAAVRAESKRPLP